MYQNNDLEFQFEFPEIVYNMFYDILITKSYANKYSKHFLNSMIHILEIYARWFIREIHNKHKFSTILSPHENMIFL